MDINKEKKKEANTKYYEKHKEKLMEKVICLECGNEYPRSCKTKHMQSKKHMEGTEMKRMKEEYKKMEEELKELKKINTI